MVMAMPSAIALCSDAHPTSLVGCSSQCLTVEYRDYRQHPDLISEYAAELVKAKVDVISTAGSGEAIRAAQQATKTIPIVAMSDDLVGLGLVGSMARPNGNTTGVSILAAELDGKRQELLIEAVPGLRLNGVPSRRQFQRGCGA
jgi:putative tryptophan/tyrosine transport system substrate-binding protein